MRELIAGKRDGGELSKAQIASFVQAITRNEVPDYQVAALLMAIYLQGMTRRETVDLTLAMAASGTQLDLHDIAPFVVDKHSSGGVGDKTSLVVLPLVAACGIPVGKMSGRGLGASGGTLDKMESFYGWRAELSPAEFRHQLEVIGLVLAGQSANLAPADGYIYALRDVTETVASVPLIASSIMSKKLAAGADGIVLDVKAGNGAFMPTVGEARELAQLMVDIGRDTGRKMVALVSDMNQPLGSAVGNALEVKEALLTLRGGGPSDFWQHCLEVAAHMVHLAGKAETLPEARNLLRAARESGQALSRFRDMVVAQGGEGRQVDEPELLPQAEYVAEVTAAESGVIAAMDTMALGWVAVHLGGGRQVKGAQIDHAVGFILPVKVGDRVPAGTKIATIHANDKDKLEWAKEEILAAITWSAENVPPLPLFYETITA
jgi:pyrimidine-nucleoside phosphorylase